MWNKGEGQHGSKGQSDWKKEERVLWKKRMEICGIKGGDVDKEEGVMWNKVKQCCGIKKS